MKDVCHRNFISMLGVSHVGEYMRSSFVLAFGAGTYEKMSQKVPNCLQWTICCCHTERWPFERSRDRQDKTKAVQSQEHSLSKHHVWALDKDKTKGFF